MKTTKYYHGGYSGLRPGDYILPPSQTGAACASDYGAESVHRRDRVYLTTNKYDAVFFSYIHPSQRGPVLHFYEADPIGDVEPDPDCTEPGLSFQCGRARIVRRLRATEDEIGLAISRACEVP